MSKYEGRWSVVKVEVEAGIAWVTFNRPEKRNAMSPTLNREMIDILQTLELDEEVGVVVLTGAGDSWTAGMDLKEYFRETDGKPEIYQERSRREACEWQWKLLAFLVELVLFFLLSEALPKAVGRRKNLLLL